MIIAISQFFRAIAALLIWPVRGLSPNLALAWVALLLTVPILLVYKYVSNQVRMKRVKHKLMGRLLEIQLYRDTPIFIFRTLGALIVEVFIYLGLSLKPLLVVIVPLSLLLVQLAGWYEWRPLKQNEKTLVKLQLADDMLDHTFELHVPPSLHMEVGPFHTLKNNQVLWSVRARNTNSEPVIVTFATNTLAKTLLVSTAFEPVQPEAAQGAGRLWSIPCENAIPASVGVNYLSIDYPTRTISLLGFRMHWIIALLLYCLFFGILLQKPLGVVV